MHKLDAAQIHQALSGRWKEILIALGVGEEFLKNKHQACPACGGRDRFRYDDKHGRGDFFCSGCGAGDGFALLQRVHGWTFPEAKQRVIEAARLGDGPARDIPRSKPPAPEKPASPSARVRDLVRSCTAPYSVQDAIDYLTSRKLWPLPDDCTLRAHASAEYWEQDENGKPQPAGRFAALVAEIRDVRGQPVSAHVTYLHNGAKLTDHTPRKILGPLTGRRGCAVRLMPLKGDTLGIAEGIETALAAHKLHGIPVWAALNTSLLMKFEPPRVVKDLVVFVDRDLAGIEAAWDLFDRLDGTVTVELRRPPRPANDWNDVLMEG